MRSWWRHRTAVHPVGPGNGDAPLVWQGAHRERRPVGTDDSHQGQGRGARVALHGQGPDDSSPPKPKLLDVFEEEPGGARPEALFVPPPQVWVAASRQPALDFSPAGAGP